ncbi:MAG: TIGR03545 family protein [bacterium]
MMRSKGLVIVLVIVALFWAAAYLFGDAFLENQLEGVGESIVGAKVEIDNFRFSLLGLSVSLDRLQVTNPNKTWNNLFEIGRLSFDMELAPLTRKKIVINEVAVEDIRIGTRRQSDGKIEIQQEEEPGWASEAADNLKTKVAQTPVLNLGILKKKANVDSLMAAFDLQTVHKIEVARETAEVTFQKWHKTVAEYRPQHRFDELEQQVKEIKPREISNLEELVTTLARAKKVIETLKTLEKDIAAKKQAARTDLQHVTSSFAQIDNWVQEDFNAVKAKANIGEFSAQSVGKMLFGEMVVLPTIELLETIELGRKYMPVAQQFFSSTKVEKPPRFKGQDIHFAILNSQPEFLMERLLLSAATNQEDTSQVLRLSGEVTAVTSQPRLYGKPLTFSLEARLPNANAYEITGAIDHTRDVPEERFQIQASGVRFGTIDLPRRPFLPSAIVAASGNIAVAFELIGQNLEFKTTFTASPVTFTFDPGAANDDAISRVTREVFAAIDRLRLTAAIVGPTGDLHLEIRSNVDDILAHRIKALVGRSVAQTRAEIRKRIDQVVAPRKQEALKFVSANKATITAEMDKLGQAVDDQLAALEAKKKEVEARINQKKKKGLEKAKDKLEGFFKKKSN